MKVGIIIAYKTRENTQFSMLRTAMDAVRWLADNAHAVWMDDVTR
jgi:hypothetical protein